MVSPLSAASTSPNAVGSVLPSTKNAPETVLSAVSVSKRNTPSAPQLHAVSFEDFGEVLSSALWRRSAEHGLDQATAEVREPDTSVGFIEATKELPKSTTDAPLTNLDGSEQPNRQHADDGKRVNGLSNKAGFAKLPASPTVSLRRADVSVNAGRTLSQAAPPTAIQDVGYVPDMANIERITPQPGSSNRGSADFTEVRGVNARLQFTPAQDQQADVDRVPTIQEEAEVLRIDLHPDPSFMSSSELTSSSNSDVKGSTEDSGGTQTPVAAATPPQGQDSRLSLIGTRPESSNQRNQTPTVSEPGNFGKSGPGPQVTALAKKESSADTAEPNKSGEPVNAEAAAEMLNHAARPSAAIFSAPVRAEAGVQQLGSLTSAAVSKTTDTPAFAQTKELVVRVEGASGTAVSVRLVDLGEQVQVAVRSADPLMAAQLRQDLTSLASNLDRIGWRTDAAVSASPQSVAPHEPSRSDSESDGANSGSKLDWDDAPGQRRNHTSPELWDMFLASENA